MTWATVKQFLDRPLLPAALLTTCGVTLSLPGIVPASAGLAGHLWSMCWMDFHSLSTLFWWRHYAFLPLPGCISEQNLHQYDEHHVKSSCTGDTFHYWTGGKLFDTHCNGSTLSNSIYRVSNCRTAVSMYRAYGLQRDLQCSFSFSIFYVRVDITRSAQDSGLPC